MTVPRGQARGARRASALAATYRTAAFFRLSSIAGSCSTGLGRVECSGGIANYPTLAAMGQTQVRKSDCTGDSMLNTNQHRADAMNLAFRQACARLKLTGSTPVIELVAVRIVELTSARTG
jgi:hypothetical protein